MKKTDDVFFFTLIDFLIQVFFFGLVIYVLAQMNYSHKEETLKADQKKIEELLHASGVSNLTELTDELTKLAPIKELKGNFDFISKNGGINELKENVKVIADAGGLQNLTAKLNKLRKIEEGSGKPPCIYTEVDGKKSPKILATVLANDTHIKFMSKSSEFDDLLTKMGHKYEAVQELEFNQFNKTFAPIVKINPECRYTIKFLEDTNLVFARDSARSIFYLRYGKP